MQHSIFANINLAGGKGGASKAVSQSKIENYKDLYFGKDISASVAKMRRELIPAVWLNVKQSSNPHAKDDAGIESNHRFAVLFTRKDYLDFQA